MNNLISDWEYDPFKCARCKSSWGYTTNSPIKSLCKLCFYQLKVQELESRIEDLEEQLADCYDNHGYE